MVYICLTHCLKLTAIKATYYKYVLDFKVPGGTSRGVLRQKETYFLILQSKGKTGIGECGLFKGLSFDDRPDYEEKLQWLCDHIQMDLPFLLKKLKAYPSIYFGLEQAVLSLESQNSYELFSSDFTKGSDRIPINGLIWMGDTSYMSEQISKKLEEGFTTLKMKIGAIGFEEEMNILKNIRRQFDRSELELRVDANGAFSVKDAMPKLERLASFGVHSIEQPIAAGQVTAMAKLCRETPVPIALDEELIGIVELEEKRKLLNAIDPHYIILKPSLVGGFDGCKEWISLSEKQHINWWITSALESNVGLNAIAQFTYTLNNKLPQGLGTGSLFTNNIEAPLFVSQGELGYDVSQKWGDLITLLEE